MLSLAAKIRKETGKKVQNLRKNGLLPAVLYGPKIKPLSLEIHLKDFEKLYKETGESTLISLETESPPKKYLVLIHSVGYNSLTEKPIHVDFYQPDLEREIEIKIPIILEGEPPAIKELGGTLVKNISEIEVKAFPQNLPKEIRIDVGVLNSFEDVISIKDLNLPKGVKILREPEEIIVRVSPPEKVEEELEKPIEEKIEEVEKVEKEKKAEEEIKEEAARPEGAGRAAGEKREGE